MNIKWKILIISMLAYQIILTFVVLNLTHYSQKLHFGDSSYPLSHDWLGGDVTMPMRKAMITLGMSFLILAIVNVIVFKKNEETE